jgi:BlaI family penicillinase repressor
VSRRVSSALTDAELRIMRALWDLERANVSEIIARMERTDDDAVPAYNSVLTVLGILERKGYVRHQKDGRAFVFEPTVDRRVARRSALAGVLSKFFDGSPSLLFLDLFGKEGLHPDELRHVRDLIEQAGQPALRAGRRR